MHDANVCNQQESKKYVKKDNSVVVVYYRIKGDTNKNSNMD